MTEGPREVASETPPRPPQRPLPDTLTAFSRTGSLAARRGLSNGFSRPAAPPPAPPVPPSRARVAMRALGVGPRPLAVGLVVGVVLFVALRALGAAA